MKHQHVTQICKQGFSLIELTIVVAVIAILAAIAIPNYLGIQRKARRAEAKAKLPAIAMALENWYAENGTYGANGVYTYVTNGGTVVGTFNHGGRIGAVANLGNNLNYDYQITVTTTGFTVQALPKAPNEITPWMQSNGQKGPNNFGW